MYRNEATGAEIEGGFEIFDADELMIDGIYDS